MGVSLHTYKNTSKKYINILGTCISRDVFRLANEEVEHYFARTSFASQFLFKSPNIIIRQDSTLVGFNKRLIEDENNKTVKLLINNMKGNILIDLFDELLDQYILEDKMFCKTMNLSNNSIIPNIEKYVKVNCDEKYQLFEKGFAAFMKSCAHNNCIEKIFIIRVRDAIIYNDNSDMNPYIGDRLDKYYEYIEKNFHDSIILIDVNKTFLVGDINHIWGKAPYHYIDDYYIEVYKKIQQNIDVP